MDGLYKARRTFFLEFILAVAFFTVSCAGPSTRVLPRESREELVEQEELLVLEEGNPFYLQEELDFLAKSPCVAGSERERECTHYIRQLLEDYGYDVTLQGFLYEEGSGEEKRTGTNVVAVRQTENKEGDILIVAAHHDTRPYSPGAGDSACGVAVLLETARLLSRLPTDTELRFISFSGYVDEQAGCRYYVDSLMEREQERVIGAVLLDEMGFHLDGSMTLATEDGRPTLLGDSIQDAGQELLGENWSYIRQETGGHSRFVRGRVPAVSVRQKREAFELGSRFDKPELVNIERLTQVVNVLSRAVSDIMSPDTPSMVAKSRHYNHLRDNAAVEYVGLPLPFGEAIAQTKARLGVEGVLASENTDNEGKLIQSYQYLVKWFGVDQPLLTNYYYSSGKLDFVSIDGDGAGVEFSEMTGRVKSVYGEPVQRSEGPEGTELVWQDGISRTDISLSPEGDGYRLVLREYQPGKQQLDSYEISPPAGLNPQMGLGHREGEEPGAQDSRTNVFLTLVRQFLPLGNETNLIRIDLYTDGVGMTRTSLDVILPEEGGGAEAEPAFVWGFDLEDALTRDGKWRNETDMVRQILLLYGEMLDQTRRYGIAFTEAFPEEDDSVEQVLTGLRPGDIPEPLPDFKESFMWFVLTDQTEEADGEWGARIRFFYQYEELAAYRTLIRNNLKIDP
ncbi:MAG: M28 family peptidase [Lachnospiraceae bacterium]|nr:M28 family peptidase [Lachnospiraceae bacterium]